MKKVQIVLVGGPARNAKCIVLAGGCFDLLHYGHIYFLKEAKKLGDYLVVLLESDARVKKLKGNSRPFHNQNQRKEILESLRFVDKVILTKDEMTDSDYKKLIKNINPQIIAVSKGSNTKNHKETVSAKVAEIEMIPGISSTKALLLDL